MSKPSDRASSRRDELTQAAVQWCASRGLRSLSLRPLAEASQTSARMLMYHFGSREELLRAVLEALIGGWERELSELHQAPGEASQVLWQLWRAHLRAPGQAQQHALAMEIWAAAHVEQDALYAPYAARLQRAWLEAMSAIFARDGASPGQASRLASMTVAAIDGLLMQAAADEAAPVDEAFKLWVSMIARQRGEVTGGEG